MWVEMFFDASVVGLLIIEMLAGLIKGKTKAENVYIVSLKRYYRIEAEIEPYGIRIFPADN